MTNRTGMRQVGSPDRFARAGRRFEGGTSTAALIALSFCLSGTVGFAQSNPLTADFTNPSGNTVMITGNLDGAGFTYSNEGVTEMIDGSISNLGTYINRAGQTTIGGGAAPQSLEAGTVSNVALLLMDDNGTITATQVDNTAGGTLTSTGEIDAAITNAGALNVAGTINGSLTNSGTNARVTVTDTLTQDGSVDIGNDTFLDVSGGDYTGATTVTNRGTVTLTNDTTLEADALNNQGAGVVTVNEDTTLDADTITSGGQITNDGTILGNINSSGTIVTTGDIQGEVTTSGSLTASGEMTGNVISSGTSIADGGLDIDGDLTVSGGSFDVNAGTTAVTGQVSNAATLRVNSGTALSATEVTNTRPGTLTSVGVITGDVNNQGAATLENQVDGNVLNTGTSSLDLSGALTVTGDVDMRDTATLNLNTANLTIDGALDNRSSTALAVGANTLLTDGLLNGTGATISTDATGTITATGAVTNQGEIVSDGTFSGASLANSGQFTTGVNTTTFDGPLVNEAGATFTQGVGTTTADSLDNDGTLIVNGGLLDIDGPATNGGDIEINAGTVGSNGLTVETGGTVDVLAPGILDTGTLQNDGTVTSLGSLDAVIINDGALSAAGSVDGDITNNGTFTVTDTLNAAGPTDLINTGTANINGDFSGLLDINNSGDLTLADGVGLSGTNFQSTDGTVALGAGAQLNTTGTTFNNGAALDLGAGATINHANTIVNSGTITVNGAGATITSDTGTINNNGGTLAVEAGSVTVSGNVSNNGGTIGIGSAGVGSATINGNLNNTGGQVDLATGAGGTGDQLIVNGNITSAGTYQFNIDLQGRTADVLTLNGATTGGQVELVFDTAGQNTGLFGAPITVARGTGATLANFTFDDAPFDNSPLVEYRLEERGDTLVLSNLVDPAIGALSGNFALVQSLLGSVINRPSSPFVSGLAFEDDDPCGSGTWTRIQGGSATATGDTDSGGVVLSATVDATFSGLQVGYDFGCFNAASGGWDLAGGAVLGLNDGSTEQKNFEFDTQALRFTDRLESITKSEFTQTFVGGYFAFAREQYSGDVQLRLDNTTFEFNNPAIDLRGAETTSHAVTLSTSLSYSYALSETWSVVPTGGFGLTWSQTDPIRFTDATGQQTGRLNIDDHLTTIGFTGVTIANTIVRPRGDSAFNRFATATVYYDFSDERETSFVQFDEDGDRIPGEAPFASENLGTFGELSLGLSYIQILDGQVGPAKQLNASVRVDSRFSERIDAVSLTAQARLQF